MSEKDLATAMLAGLLHDLGHYPLAHDIYEANPNFISHEEVGANIIADRKSSLYKNICGDWGVDPENIFEILDGKAPPSIKTQILRSLIDGPLDCDKIDYIDRDSKRLQLKYGEIIDFERLLKCLTIIVWKQDNGGARAALGLHEKGIVVAEAIWFARYALYCQVYWHHTYRSFKVMFHHLIWDAMIKFSDIESDFRAFIGKGNAWRLETENWDIGDDKASSNNFYDVKMIKWFQKRAGPKGKLLGNLVLKRMLFKRMLVISPAIADDRQIYNQLIELWQSADHQSKIYFCDTYQSKILLRVEESLSRARKRFDADNLIHRANSEVLILVDVPRIRNTQDERLRFLLEDNSRLSRRPGSSDLVSSALSTSAWCVLHDEAYSAAGKVRVFCHEDFADALSAFIERDTLTVALGQAIVATRERFKHKNPANSLF